MVSQWIHEEINQIREKKIAGCYAFYFAITNIGVEILMNIQIFLVKTAFFSEGIQRSSLILRKQTNKARYVFDESCGKSGDYCK